MFADFSKKKIERHGHAIPVIKKLFNKVCIGLPKPTLKKVGHVNEPGYYKELFHWLKEHVDATM